MAVPFDESRPKSIIYQMVIAWAASGVFIYKTKRSQMHICVKVCMTSPNEWKWEGLYNDVTGQDFGIFMVLTKWMDKDV